jgi:hypothetical protein
MAPRMSEIRLVCQTPRVQRSKSDHLFSLHARPGRSSFAITRLLRVSRSMQDARLKADPDHRPRRVSVRNRLWKSSGIVHDPGVGRTKHFGHPAGFELLDDAVALRGVARGSADASEVTGRDAALREPLCEGLPVRSIIVQPYLGLTERTARTPGVVLATRNRRTWVRFRSRFRRASEQLSVP